MGKRPVQDHSEPTKLTVGKDHFKTGLEGQISLGLELLNRQIQTREQLQSAREEYYKWNSFNSELLKQSFNNEQNEYRKSYDDAGRMFFALGGSHDELQEHRQDVKRKVDNLKQLFIKIPLMKSAIEEGQSRTANVEPASIATNEIFIVHGHDNELKVEVARTLEKLGLSPVILHEQPNAGKTIIEKFEKYSEVGFAVVLLTDDDEGKARNETETKPRARQNVILELGYFIGKLGRSRVCPLYTNGVELPTDYSGVLYTEIDKGGNWKLRLVKELKAAGYKVDANRII